jgi:hypothetical protein
MYNLIENPFGIERCGSDGTGIIIAGLFIYGAAYGFGTNVTLTERVPYR